MYRSRLLRWAGIALATLALVGTLVHPTTRPNATIQVAEDPKTNPGG